MSRTASVALKASSASVFSRLLAVIDRWLLAYAEMQIRNGDVPRFGL